MLKSGVDGLAVVELSAAAVDEALSPPIGANLDQSNDEDAAVLEASEEVSTGAELDEDGDAGESSATDLSESLFTGSFTMGTASESLATGAGSSTDFFEASSVTVLSATGSEAGTILESSEALISADFSTDGSSGRGEAYNEMVIANRTRHRTGLIDIILKLFCFN